MGNKSKVIKWKRNITVEYMGFERFDSVLNYCSYKEYNSFITRFYFIYRGLAIRNKINEINKINKIDIIHYCNLLSVALYPNKNIPHVLRLSSFPGMERATNEELNFNADVVIKNLNKLEKLELDVFKKIKYVISPSKITADMIKKHINKKVTVIESPFHIKTDNWNDMIYDEILKDKKYLLFYGRLTRGKGIHLINEIIYRLLDHYKDLYFVVIGNDKTILNNEGKAVKVHRMLKTSAKEHSDRVICLKAISKEKLMPIVDNARLCVLPSVMDNLPNTCIESMALGKIVIGARGASFDQLIIDGCSGFLCENSSTDSLYSTIEKCMKLSPDEVSVISHNAKERINRLNPQRVYNNYMKYYKHVISNH
jgi:glycosyltransferase involved in cell wall biosynthesis